MKFKDCKAVVEGSYSSGEVLAKLVGPSGSPKAAAGTSSKGNAGFNLNVEHLRGSQDELGHPVWSCAGARVQPGHVFHLKASLSVELNITDTPSELVKVSDAC